MTNSNAIFQEVTQQMMNTCGVSWFKFDEPDGDAMDSIGDVVGTVYNNATRVEGWNGLGSAMNFNGTSTSYINFNSQVIPMGSYTVRFKMKLNEKPILENQEIISCSFLTASHRGIRVWINTDGNLIFTSTYATSGKYDFTTLYQINFDNNWYDYMLVWDTANKKAYMYVNGILVSQDNTVTQNTVAYTYNLRMGNQRYTGENRYFKGQIDEFQIYNKALTPENFILNKSLILHNEEYKKNVSEIKQHPIDKYTPIKTLIFKDDAINNQIVGLNGSKINVVNGIVTSSDGVNRFDKSLYFNGASSIHLDTPLLPIGDKTVDFYFKTSMTGVGTFFSTADGLNTSTNGFLVNISLGKINMAMKVGGTGWNISSLPSINSFNDGKWHNARFVFKNGSYIRMYVDGNLEHNTNHSLIEITQGYNLCLGARAGSNTTQGSNPIQFVGNIANFRVYNTAITDDIPPLIESFHWNIVSTLLPTTSQFLEQGMDNISPLLDRNITTLEPMKMIDKSEILDVDEVGKVFSKAINLKKYFDIRSMKVEVK